MNRFALGLILIVLGSLFLLDRLDLMPNISHYIFSWPNILFLIAIGFLLSGKPKGAAVFILIGAFFWLQRHFYIDMRFVWPVALIGVGLYLLLRRGGTTTNTSGGEPVTDDSFDDSVIFSGSEKTISSKNLKGGKVTAVFGGSDLNLREAVPAESCVLDVFVLFGGAELKIPANWNVKLEASPVFGGVSDERDQTVAKDGPTVVIKGTAIFGGVSLK